MSVPYTLNLNGSVDFVAPWQYLTRALNHPQTTAEIAQLSQAVVVCHVSQLPPYQLQFHLQTRKKEQDLEYILV